MLLVIVIQILQLYLPIILFKSLIRIILNTQVLKKLTGVYVRNFTSSDIAAFKAKAEKNNYEPYNISTSTPYLYVIRETGGISTNAFIDGRNKVYGTNHYVNSKVGSESYVVNLGYASVLRDWQNLSSFGGSYVDGILESVREYLGL